jgi:Glycosyl transferase 4-like domain
MLHSRYRSGPVSGENRVVDDEARLLRDAGHVVDVFDPEVATSSALELVRSAVSTVWSLGAGREVASRIARDAPGVVHVHNLFPALSPAVLRAVPDRIPCVMTLHNYRQLCLPGTFLRDGRICEDCFGRSLWPGVVHGCYQGSIAASGVLASSLTLHRSIGSFRRVDLYVAISSFVRDKHVEAGLPEERLIVKLISPGQRDGAAARVRTSSTWVGSRLRRESPHS